MKAKVLFYYYSDGSGFQPVRVYLEKDFIQANKDYEMMCEFASDSRTWKLEDVDLFDSSIKHESEKVCRQNQNFLCNCIDDNRCPNFLNAIPTSKKMNITYFQPKGIHPQYCEAGIVQESDPDYIWYLNEPCKILISEVKIIPNENVVYDKKNRSYNVKSEIL